MSTWKTLDGRVLEIAWMDSQHLVNSANLVLRRLEGPLPVRIDIMRQRSSLYPELDVRWLLHEASLTNQLFVPAHRETRLEMCMLRAILDTNTNCFIDHWYSDHHDCFQMIVDGRDRDEACTTVYLKFAEYRLVRA